MKLYRIMKDEKFDVIITFATKPNIYGRFAAFLAGVPTRIVAIRGLGRTFNSAESIKSKHFN